MNLLKGNFAPATLALPIGILMLIVLMVLPIPTFMLDMFFVLNITISVAILMAAMNAAKPLDFSSFPSVLLFATLLRLALNVASTRIVLVSGHEGDAAAGQVIESFGRFLIDGNFAVGLFVFVILLIINMVVVTKGAGRVSEVSARFTLDALPGKQMAIDSDIAAGLMTSEEAKARRAEVSTEADFYGAMDGASKFVKGDAIAALLILGINIIAGFCLGMLSHGMAFGEAAETYITLAVGDALVAQVPALLLSIAAAVIVTRVADKNDHCRSYWRPIFGYAQLATGRGCSGGVGRNPRDAADGVSARRRDGVLALLDVETPSSKSQYSRGSSGRNFSRAYRNRGCQRPDSGHYRAGLWSGASG